MGGTPSRKVKGYWGGNIYWLSSGEIANCRITSSKETITEEGLQNSNAKVNPPKTVLIAMIGEGKTRGQSAILDTHSCTNQNVAAIVFDTEYVSPEYVWRWALGEYENNRAVGRGGSQPALNGQKVRELIIPLPPLPEQQEIVRRVDALFAFADSIEAKVAAAREKTERLRQSILAKAFSGELVPTEAEIARQEDREYESAGELLERIRKEGKVSAK
ncbi:Type I restriction enzyme StySPI specificity protein [Methanolobus psychrophilus R15]|nr:Type I restriction enzyme StySPI specificity protein [Methanolobus psychrophilus R15]